MSGGQEGGDIEREGGNEEAEAERRYAEEEIAWSEGGRSNRPPHEPSHTKNGPEKPKRDWVDYITTGALVLTFLAALAAAGEADRLARDTEQALSDARIANQTNLAATERAENLTADALGQAQANANGTHADNVAALQAAHDANVSARDVALAQARAAQSQAETSKREAAALERTAIAGRPYIFVDVVSDVKGCAGNGDMIAGGQRAVACVNFQLTNFGDTPAVVTSIDSHYYVGDTWWGHDTPQTIKENIAYEIEFAHNGATTSVGGGWERQPKGSDSFIIPGHDTSGEATQKFVFYNLPPMGASARTQNSSIFRAEWFWIVVHYRDIYGCARVTSQFSPVDGTGGFTKTEYNYWDAKPCANQSRTEPPKGEPTIPPQSTVHPMTCNFPPNLPKPFSDKLFLIYVKRYCH